jgi:hypothetical protein
VAQPDLAPALSPVERARVGLCGDCQHARRIVSAKGSSFWLCQRAVSEPERFKKYPALPMRACDGFVARR